MTAQNLPPAPRTGLLRIHAVARATGVSAHALRAWERRYGKMSSQRSDAGYRLFSAEDLDRVRQIKSLLDLGHDIGEIATLSAEQLAKLRKRAVGTLDLEASNEGPLLTAQTARRFLSAIERLEPDEAERALAAAQLAFEPYPLVADVIAPLLVEIGNRWQDGSFSVAQEHAASSVIRNQLSDMFRALGKGKRGRLFLCTTPEGEIHELGALMAAVVMVSVGARAVYLGPSLPAKDIAFAIEKSRADALLLSVVALPAKAARAELTAVRRLVPGNVEIYAGGGGLGGTLPGGIIRIRDLDALRRIAV